MATKHVGPTSVSTLTHRENGDNAPAQKGIDTVIIQGQGLTISEITQVARHGAQVKLTDDQDVVRRVEASCGYIADAVKACKPIYGVTTGFGGMAHLVIPPEEASRRGLTSTVCFPTGDSFP